MATLEPNNKVKFINPYNFIPLSAKSEDRDMPRESSGQEKDSLFTGKIHYSVETVTPLFIPNTSNDKIFGVNANHEEEKEYHKSYDFFSYNDLSNCASGVDQPYYTPVIPGSEMRGAIRSIYEALTDSCLSALDEDAVFSRRTPERYSPGLLVRNKDGSYVLKKAEDYICRDSEDFSVFYPEKYSDIKDGTLVHYKFSSLNKNRKPYAKKIVDIVTNPSAPAGYIIKGMYGPDLPKPSRGAKCEECPPKTQKKCRAHGEKECYLLMKHNIHVFVDEKGERGDRSKSWKISEENIRILSNVLEIYKKNNGEAYKEYRETWDKFNAKELDTIPVYYSEMQFANKKEEILLSPACTTREVYKNTLKTVLGSHYLPCKDKEHLCPACRLFGTVNNGLAKASVVRFSDLKAEEKEDSKDYYGELLTLDELGQPKPTSMEFYLKKPEVRLKPGEQLLAWTFDYYITVDKDGKPSIYFYTPEIAGRKFYWHSSKVVKRQKTLQNAMRKEEEWHKTNPDQDKFITKRNKTVRPVRSGITFYGDLYFNQITKTQMEQLIAVLNMSKSNQYGIKIGGAKPLGLGSVKLKVLQVDYRKVLNEDIFTYQCQHYDFQDINISGVCNEELLNTVFSFNAVDEDQFDVAYPYVDSLEDEGFIWFGANRKAFEYDRKMNRVNIDKTSDGPVTRKQVPYLKHMEPLKPELAESSFGKSSGNTGNRNGNRNTGHQSSQSFKLGEVCEGMVIGYNPSGKFAKVKLDDGRFVDFYDEIHQYNNQRVKLVYTGKSRKGNDIWNPVK